MFLSSCAEDSPVLPSSPVANAGDDRLVEVFDTVYLQGSLKKIPAAIEYVWTFEYKPEGSQVKFSDSSSSNPFFIPDVEGFYNVQLVVRVGESYSQPDYVVIHSIYKKSKQYFPNSVGSKWIYKTTNLNNEVDTFTIQIVGDTILVGNEQATIWVSDINTPSYFYKQFDTLYFESIDDTLIFKRWWGYDWITMASYIVPFEVGNSWYDGTCYYSIEEESNVGSFTNAYKIKENRPWTTYLITTDSWFVPRIGLVKRDFYESDFMYSYEEHWELIYFNFVE